MFCKNCGNEVKRDQKFCSECGYKLQENNNIKSENKVNIINTINSINEEGHITYSTKFIRKRWITILLFLIPYTSLFGIHDFYNKRTLRGLLYITLDFFMVLFTDFIPKDFYLYYMLVCAIILYLFISDLIWIIKLPRIYFIKQKYKTKTIVLVSIIPLVLFLGIFLSREIISETKQLIEVMNLSNKPQEIEDIFNKMGINTSSIISTNYDEILKGGFTYEKSNFEITNGTEEGYRIKLVNGSELIAYCEKGDLLGIKLTGGEYLYSNGKILHNFSETMTLKEEKYKKIQQDLEKKVRENKILKIGEMKEILLKEVIVKSVEFKKEVYPSKTNRYYNYYKAEDGQVYIHIVTSIKNLSKASISCDDLLNIKADYNNGYIYSAFSTVEDDNLGFGYSNLESISPLQRKTIHYLISVPEEVKTNKKAPLILKFSSGIQEYQLKIR